MLYLNTEEASKVLECSRGNVQHMVRQGKLMPINPYHERGYLFEKDVVENYKLTREGSAA